eukprot:6620344-Pyramimonas_sp.AAC.1
MFVKQRVSECRAPAARPPPRTRRGCEATPPAPGERPTQRAPSPAPRSLPRSASERNRHVKCGGFYRRRFYRHPSRAGESVPPSDGCKGWRCHCPPRSAQSAYIHSIRQSETVAGGPL